MVLSFSSYKSDFYTTVTLSDILQFPSIFICPTFTSILNWICAKLSLFGPPPPGVHGTLTEALNDVENWKVLPGMCR